jgi:hypothetical protein
MTVTRLIPQGGTIKFADTSAAITAAPDYMCQVNHASADPVLAYNTTPATGCAGEVQQLKTPVPWQLTLQWLQDWGAAAGGLAGYANMNAGQVKYFEYVPTASSTLKVAGQVEIAPVSFAGDMGVVAIAGPVSWSIIGPPTFTLPTTLEADAADEETASV